MSDRSPSRPTEAGHRPRLHRVYYALAAFDLLAVCLSLLLIDRVTGIYTDSVADNQVWAARLDDLSALSRLASDVNRPGNEAFRSSDISAKREEVNAALRTFRERMEKTHHSLMRDVDDAEAREFARAFEEIDQAMAAMAGHAHEIFDSIDTDRAAAGQSMAAMDHEYDNVNRVIVRLGQQVREIQTVLFKEQTAEAISLRRFEILVGALIVIMVAAITVYGHVLARRMKRDAQQREHDLKALSEAREQLEHRVRERTEELRETYERLRMSERFASIGTLAAGLGHDMNNVLFPLRCRVDALRTNGEAVTSELDAIENGIDYLQRLSEGLRMLSLDPQQSMDEMEATNLDEWWEDASAIFQTVLPSRAHLHLQADESLPPVQMAPHRLLQAVFNLVINAGEAIRPDGTITITARRHDHATVEFAVTDDGHGMKEEDRQRALDPFYTTKKRRLSTGLGLPLVNALVSAAGGSLDIESEPGSGTTVRFIVPAAQQDSEEEALTFRARLDLDDARIRGVFRNLLSAAGVEVTRQADSPNGEPMILVRDRSNTNASDRGSGDILILVGGEDDEAAEPHSINVSLPIRVGEVRAAIESAIDRLRMQNA